MGLLIIACSCALGPARRHRTDGKVDTLVVDKTGTLTEGKPRLTQVVPTHSVSEEELLRAEAAIEAT